MPDFAAWPAIAWEFRYVLAFVVCAVLLLWLVADAWAETACRDAYRRAGVAWTDAEAAELERGVRADLHMPEPDPVIEIPLPPYADDLAWQRLLMAVGGTAPATAAYIAEHEAASIDDEWLHFDERSAG